MEIATGVCILCGERMIDTYGDKNGAVAADYQPNAIQTHSRYE